MSIYYEAAPTIMRFFDSNAFVRFLKGPFGSGKSTGCTVEFMRRARAQAPSEVDGVRRTRAAVVRNTYRELDDTTRVTMAEWLPPDIARWNQSDFQFELRVNEPDGTSVECDILLRALDRPEDVGKLFSAEYTFAWLNEAREIPKAILDGLTGRVGRYPSDRHGGPTWSGIWADSNPCDDDHWLYKLFEEFKDIDECDRHLYESFHQPSGLAPDAENIEHLLRGAMVDHPKFGRIPLYYARMLPGKTKEWIEVFVHGRYGFVKEGKPVYEEYVDTVHTAPAPIPWNGGPLTLGMDFGLTPAIVVLQRASDLQWQAIEEFTTDDMGAQRFSEHVKAQLMSKYDGILTEVRGWGDPAGSTRAQTDEQTPYDVVQAAGLPIYPAHTNDFILRREAVANCLTRLTLTGRPALSISPACRKLRKAMNGGYHYKRVAVSGEERYADKPNKNHFSHVAEGLQYAMVGEGMDSEVLGGQTKMARKPRVTTALGRNQR